MSNRIDLLIQGGFKSVVYTWMAARGLGTYITDNDPASPTFGQQIYTHTDPNSNYLWWNHPSGKIVATLDETDPENPIVTYFQGFYCDLRFNTVEDMEASIGDWMMNNTATSILDGFNGIGGEGITVVAPEEVQAHLDGIGAPQWEWLGTGLWSDPRLWYLSPVMIGDEREFGDPPVLYRSLIDFNVWTPTTYPQGWELVEVDPPAVAPWVQGGGTGTAGSYNLGDIVSHDRPQDGGEIWVFQSAIPANTTEPSRDSTFDRWWTPLSRLSDYDLP